MPISDELLLMEILEGLLADYRRRRVRTVYSHPKHLELWRLPSFSHSLASLLEREVLLREYGNRQRGLSREAASRHLIGAMVLDWLMRFSEVDVDNAGNRTWAVQQRDGLAEVAKDLLSFTENGVTSVRVGFTRPPFAIVRPPGRWPANVTMVEGIVERADGTVFADGQGEQVAFSALDRLVISMSLVSQGRIPPYRTDVLRGHEWELEVPEAERFDIEQLRRWPEGSWEQRAARWLQSFGEPASLARLLIPVFRVDRDATALQETYSAVRSNFGDLTGDARKRFLGAWRRRLMASERVWEEDRIVDYLILLESLLLEGRDELRFRTALYTSVLIGDSPDQREAIFKRVLEAYDIRSDIVHGGSPENTSSLANECEDICILVLQRYLQVAQSGEAVPVMLRRRVSRGDLTI